jgi:hypothetical protein
MPFGVTPQAGGVDAPPRKRRWRSVAAVAILVMVLAGVGYAVSRQRDRMTVVPSRPTTPSVTQVTPDTTRKMAQQAAPTLAPPAAPTPPVVTHDDSVRIAAAVQKRVAAAKLRDSIAKAKLAQETERKMMDSIIAANSGAGAAPANGPRRLVIAEPPEISQWPEAALLGHAVGDSLRRMLRTRARQYTLVDQDSVRMVLSRTRDVSEMSRTLGSDLLVSIRLTLLPRDSAMMMVQLWDLGATNAYRTRASGGRKVAKNEVLAGLDAVLLSAMTYLDEMSRAPRRPTPPAPTPPSGR